MRDGDVQLSCQEAQHYQHVTQAKLITDQKRSRLIINLTQTEEAEKDVERLHKVMDTLKNYPGRDEVSLAVVAEDEKTNLEIPQITVNYCSELASELSNILGESSLRVEQRFTRL